MNPLQTSQIRTNDLFDVRDRDLNLLGYTLRSPKKCWDSRQRGIVVPVLADRSPVNLRPWDVTTMLSTPIEYPSWREVEVRVMPIQYQEHEFYTWSCTEEAAIDLAECDWICGIGRDKMHQFVHDLARRSRERWELQYCGYRNFSGGDATGTATTPPTRGNSPKAPEPQEELFVVYEGRRINFK